MSHSIKNLIKNAEQVSLSGSQLENITKGECAIKSYDELENCSTIDDCFDGKQGLILLYQQSPSYGHWVILWKENKNTLRFFDSLGYTIDQELPFSKFNLRKHNGEQVPHLSALIDKSNYKLIQNKTKFQKSVKDDNTCGRWVAIAWRFRGYSISEFESLFKGVDGDYVVSSMTLLYSNFED